MVLVCPRPLYDVIDPFYFLRGQDRLLVGLVRGHIYLLRSLGSLRLLFRGKFPLPREEEILVFPVLIARILRIQLDEFFPLGLEVVHPRGPRIPLNPIHMHELLHA